MFKTILLTGVIAALCATAAFPGEQTVTQLKACGSEAKNDFGSHKEYPATNEGAGYVSFQTENVDAAGTKERFTLVNCATRKLVQLNVEYLLTDSSKGLPPQGDMFAWVEALRNQKKLANEALFAQAAKGQGFEVVNGQLPEAYTEKARRADCGCTLYYPETMSGVIVN